MSKIISVRYDLLRDNVKYGEAKGIGPAAVSMDIRRKIKRVFSGCLVLPKETNRLKDQLRVVLLLDGKEISLGRFLLTGCVKVQEKGEGFSQCEGYDLGYQVQSCRTEHRMFFAKGQRYLDAIQSLLQLCGIELCAVSKSDKVFAVDRCDWEIGTSVLDIVNELLDEIGYETLWFDSEGVAQLHPVKQVRAEELDHWYGPSRGEDYALLEGGCFSEDDLFDRYNVVTVICDNPDLEDPLIATAVNDDPLSPLSVPHRGRIVAPPVKVKNIPDQKSLQEYADRLLWEMSMAQETTVVQSSIGEGHGCGDIVALEGGVVPGIYREIGWAVEIAPNGGMEHTLRRVIYR